MKEATQRLLELGLSDKEAQVYLAMLSLGPSGILEISKAAGVTRTTTYAIVEDLQRRGLVSSVTKGKRIQYSATSPAALHRLLEKQLDDLEARKKRIHEVHASIHGAV